MSILASLLKDLFVRKRAARSTTGPTAAEHPAAAPDTRAPDTCVPDTRPQAPAQGPTHAPAENPPASNSAYFAEQQNKLASGIATLDAIVKRAPGDVEAVFSLGQLYEMADRNGDATACYRKALALDAAHYGAMMSLHHLMQNQCAWEGLASSAAALRQAVRADSPGAGMTAVIEPFSFLALPGTTAAEQQRCAERYAHALFHQPEVEAACKRLAFTFRERKNTRIRIGYLSYDFFSHATARLMARTFELHDRGRFHITAYSYGVNDASPMRKRLEKAFDRFVEIVDASDEEAAKQIHADGIDILVDLKGYTQRSRSGILALRPAPIQVNYLGYPGTMGTHLVDYLIADGFVIPPGMRPYYTEKVVCLPDCYQPNDDTRPRPPAPSRAACGLPEPAFVFCCFNQTYKITPEMFTLWCRLLQAVPGSCLWLWASDAEAEGHLRAEAARHGVAPQRLIMAPFVADAEQHLARLQCADLFLDTLPYNAHTTCSDALWMGVPVVTCPGETFPARVAGSLLTAMGVPELIAPTLEDYYRLALALATDRQKLAGIRSKISANRAHAPLFDSRRFTRNLEQAYLRMVEETGSRHVYQHGDGRPVGAAHDH